MKKPAAVLMSAMAMATASVAIAPLAQADICAGVGGRHYAVGGCTNVARDVVDGVAVGEAINSSAFPTFPGELPCYTLEGVPYYTPPGDPC